MQKPAEIRYLELANYPISDFLTVVQHSSFISDGDSISLEKPVLKIIRKAGVTWKGQPVAPSEDTGFPLERLCSISNQQGHPDGPRDTDTFGDFVTAGRCPVICSLAKSLDAVVQHSWIPKNKRKSNSISHLMESGDFFIAYKGPPVGKEITGRAGIPFFQSIAIEADVVDEDTLESGLSALRADGDKSGDDLWRFDRRATFIHLDPTKTANGLWMLTTCLPLPEEHGIPYDFNIPCDGLSVDVFFRELAKQAKKPIQSFSWLNDMPTRAWIQAANSDVAGYRMATHIMSLNEPRIEQWLKPFLDGSEIAHSDSHKLWIHPLASVIHQMYLDWWMHESSPNPNMLEKFKRFISSALTEYSTDPAPLGQPSAEGATFLLTLYAPDVKSWCDQYFPALFRSTIFLAPYIANYSNIIRVIPSSQKGKPSSLSQPLLSPQESAKRNSSSTNRTTMSVASLTSASLYDNYFNAGDTPPVDLQKMIKQNQNPKRQRLFDDKPDDLHSELEFENEGGSGQRHSNRYSNYRRAETSSEQYARTNFKTLGSQQDEEDEYQREARLDKPLEHDASLTAFEDLIKLSDTQTFSKLPKLNKTASRSKAGIPKQSRVYPGIWRTSAISKALAISGMDYFDAADVERSDNILQNAIKPTAAALKSWTRPAKESSEDSKKPALAPGAFDVKKFVQLTMNPLQHYALFACATRPAHPAAWKIVTRVDPDEEHSNQFAIDQEDLTFPGFMSAKAGIDWTDKRSGNTSTPQAAISELIRSAHQASRLNRGPVKANFDDSFHKAIGRIHLHHYKYSSIEHAENTESCWSALHWMQSAHNHQSGGQQQLRLPSGGYSAKVIRDTARNMWWFHNLLAETGQVFNDYADGRTNFGQNGLLSNKLIHISRWIEAESPIDTIWSSTDLSSDRREKLSAHFCTKLSDLLNIFQRWMETHPHSEPVRCTSFRNEFATRDDLFVLDNYTTTKQNKREPVSVDLKEWQDDFDRDFSEAHLQTTALDWPPLFPQALKPPAAFKQPQAAPERNRRQQDQADRNQDPDKGGYKQGQQQRQQQPAQGNQEDNQKRPGEYLIADVPALRLKSDHPHEFGAIFNIGTEILEAKKANVKLPNTPKVNGKFFCFRFMTAKCGCRTGPGLKASRFRPASKPCDRYHLDLAPKSGDCGVPRELLEQIIELVEAAPLNEKIEPTPELRARVQK